MPRIVLHDRSLGSRTSTSCVLLAKEGEDEEDP
jgi:hypothetical protein